jgi:hypothetical protein
LGEPNVFLPRRPEEKGYRVTKSPGVDGAFPRSQRAGGKTGHKEREAGKVPGSE